MGEMTRLLLAFAIFSLACGDDDGGVDASTDGGMDATTFGSSTDTGDMDAGDRDRDAGDMDAGDMDASELDAGDMDAGDMDAGDMDAGDMDGGFDGGPMDGGFDGGSMDAGMDAGPMEMPGIAEVRAAAPGSHVPTLPVRGVIVTYVRAAIGDDPAGFFVQSEMTGPAVFVAEEPSPTPAVGDVVDFDVTETTMVSGMLHVTGIAGYTRDSTGADVASLVQTLTTATDLISNYTNYEAELVEIRGTINAIPIVGGTAHFVAPFLTTGMDDMDFLLRIPQDVAIDNELREGCTLTATAPLWRFIDDTQVQPLVTGDLSSVSCPALPGATPSPGELVITEVFFDDGIAGPDGPVEWVELFNATGGDLQLYGCELDDDPAGGGAPRIVVQSVVVAAGDYVVFGGDMSEASAVGPYGPALNNTGDSAVVRCEGSDIDAMTYTTGTPGSSLQLDPRSTTTVLNDDPANWCAGTTSYGTMGFFGTPASDNPTCSTSAELMITEYIEGSSQNKAVEISNIGGASFGDLSACTLELYSNGADVPTNTFAFPVETLAAGATYTICNAGADAALLTICDATSTATFFNGNDALVLNCGGVIDALGQVGFDPGTAWTSGGVSTLNQTLRRACTARTDTDDADAFVPSLEWESFAIDTFDDFGSAPACP